MTSFIVLSSDKDKRNDYLKKFYKKENIDPIDVTVVSIDNSVKQNVQSIGIDDIKFMQKKIFLKPLRSGNKAIVLEDAQLLTTEAQNALLKVLEEPPQKTLIILSAATDETFLPTILSRCFVINLGETNQTMTEKEKKDFETFLQEFPEWGIGERLKKAEALAKDKDKALGWLSNVIILMREHMVQSENPSTYAEQIKHLQSLHTLLKTTNVNPRFAIENALLNI